MALCGENNEGIRNGIKTREGEVDSQSTMGWQVVRDSQRLCQPVVLLIHPAARERYCISTNVAELIP